MNPRRAKARSGPASRPGPTVSCARSGVTREGGRSAPPPSRFDEFARMLLGCCSAVIGSASGYISISDESLTTDKAVDLDSGGFRGVGDPTLPLSLRGMRDVVRRSGRVVYSNRFSESPWFAPLPAGAAPLDNVLLAPLQLDAKTIGVLGLANKPGGFTDDDARRARQFGDLVVSGLELNRLSESVEKDDARFRAVCAIVTDAIVSIDSRGVVTFWSRSAEQIFGRSEQEAVGAPFTRFLAERSQVSFCGRAVPCPTSLLLYALRSNGEEIPIEFTCARWEPEKPHLCTAIVREVTERQPEETPRSVDPLELEREVRDRTADLVRVNHALQQEIAERKRIEDELRQSRAMIERIADTTPDIVYLYDLEQRTYPYINRRLTDVLGYEPDECAGDGDVLASRVVHPEDLGFRAQRFARLAEAAHGEVIESEYRVLSKGGEYRWLQLRETVFTRSGDGSVGQILGVARDITATKRVELSVLEASEAERRRIGQDLHDGLGQVLTGVALVGKRLERRVEARTLPGPADVRQLLDLVTEAMGEAKKIARGLFPVVLETEGLRAALEEHARDVTALSETLCVVEGAAGPSALSRFRAIHLFRIAQEAVHNAVRHGRAKKITITLRERADETVLDILDDGAGISDERLIRGNGMGLPSMRYRARLIGATLDVRRHPDGGTILTCRLGEGSRLEESARVERTDSRTTSPGEVGPGKRHAEQ